MNELSCYNANTSCKEAGHLAGVEIAGVRQSEDCQKFGRTAEDGVSGSPTVTRQIREYFYNFLFTMSIFNNGNDPYWHTC